MIGRHHIKFGNQFRYSYDQNGAPGQGQFNFNAVDTANTFNSPDFTKTGNMYASLLLGAINGGNARFNPLFYTHQYQLGLYIQDDIHVSRRLTVNLGLRYEYEAAPRDENLILSRGLDLTSPIPQFLNNPPQIPGAVTAISKVPYKFNGAWKFTNAADPRLYRAPPTNFLPRIGVAFRINDVTALRAGYARYAVPVLSAHPEGWSLPKDGFSQTTTTLPAVEGVPKAWIDNPYNASNPVRLAVGKGRGRYTNLGDNATWYNQRLRTPMNDRFNVSLQRQLPWGVAIDTTFFMNLGHNVVTTSMWGGDYSLPLNLMDPNLKYKYKGAVDQKVANPFYGLPSSWFPGTLRSQKTIAASALLKPYPQYGTLRQQFMWNRRSHYYAFQFKAQKYFSNGLSFIFGYNYNQQIRSEWYDDIAQYNNAFSMFDSRQPRHNVRLAGTYQLPIGKGRSYLNNLNPVLNAIVGGWQTSSIFMWNNGPLLSFGTMQASGNPKIGNPTRDRWFDTSKFAIQPPYTQRTNPWYYDGLRGPGFWSWDATAAKYFQLNERFKLEFRMEFYNFPNSFMPTAISTNVNSSNFGKSINQQNYGREIQYTVRLHF
jgi:hypothetical protein